MSKKTNIVILGAGYAGVHAAKKLAKKYKKNNDIQTFKEIVSFTEGKRLDQIEKAQEFGKRPYQKILSVFVCAIISFFVCMLFVWLLKSFIF